MGKDILNVYETFSSIQGESSKAGLPCFFIRLAGCNLSCTYCDTIPARAAAAGKEMSVDSLVALAKGSGLKLVEITGGEPLVQAGTPDLCRKLISSGFEVMVETNGSLDASILPDKVVRVIDYKTPYSGEASRMLASNFAKLRPHDEVKFVISGREDYLFALRTISRCSLASQTRNLLLSPISGSLNPAQLVKWIIEDKAPVRVNLQLHKVIWGPGATGV